MVKLFQRELGFRIKAVMMKAEKEQGQDNEVKGNLVKARNILLVMLN